MLTKKLASAVIIAGVALLLTACAKTNTTSTNTNTAATTNSPTSTATTNTGNGSGNGNGSGQNRASATWVQTADGWQASGTPPACPNPANLPSPVDLTQVTSILYPGQTRGGNYKPHGGFRMDTATSNDVRVTIPMAGEVVDGSRYLVNGETQYTFDIMTPCGWMLRFGHFLKLTSAFQAIADTFPAPQENDSRTTNVNPRVPVTVGEQIATAVGVTVGGRNVFFDFGVYNFNTKNAASADAAWAASHDPQLAQHALCWFGLLSPADEATVRALPPADGNSGKTSDYCK